MKKIYEPWKKFRDDEHQWFRVAEQQFDNYMLSKKTLSRPLQVTGTSLIPLFELDLRDFAVVLPAAPRSGSCSDRSWGRCRARPAPIPGNAMTSADHQQLDDDERHAAPVDLRRSSPGAISLPVTRSIVLSVGATLRR